jgi:serine/threonine-protein kinase
MQGRWREAARSYQDAVAAGDRNPAVAAKAIRMRRLAELHPRLPAYLGGALKPADNDEREALARLCQHERLFAAAARLLADALAADPRLSENPRSSHRYNAACFSALAAAGKGGEALGDAEKARLRRQALDWLKADLALWGKLLDGNRDAERGAVGGAMHHWQQDVDLAGVREEVWLAELPAGERKAWDELWSAVAGLRKKADGK